jgi:hypothetical protein
MTLKLSNIRKETKSREIIIKGSTPPEGYVRNPLNGFPRNTKCICGSGIKFKLCCSKIIPYYCTEDEAHDLLEMLATRH